MGWALQHLGEERCRDLARGLFRVTKDEASRSELVGLCPIHGEKNASFSYNWRKDTYHCLSCGADGDLVRLWCLVKGLDERGGGFQRFKEEVGCILKSEHSCHEGANKDSRCSGSRRSNHQIIPEKVWAGLRVLPETWLLRLERARGWSRQVIQASDLRLWVSPSGEERVAIPVRDESGQLVNIRLYLPGARDNKIFSWGKGYGQARLWPEPGKLQPGPVWLCEGEPDCLCARSLGLNAVTQTAGAKTWKPSFNATFTGREVIIAYDADQQGRDGAQRVAHALARRAKSVRIIQWPELMTDHQDLTDFVVKHGKGRTDLEALASDAKVYQSQPGQPDDDKNDGDSPVGPERFWAHSHDGRMSFRPALLAKEMMEEMDLVTCRETQVTYRWNGQYFRPATDADLMRQALLKLADSATTSRARDAVSQVQVNSASPTACLIWAVARPMRR
jgi:putative DNA primase/helicase